MKESHPVADIFPMLPHDDLMRLSEDIATRGLLEPVVMLDDMILDGRNRYAACKLAGVTPDFVTFSGDDALGYVIAKNMHRRHLNESQRAVVASRIANLGNGQRASLANLPSSPVTQPQAAMMLNVSPRSVTSVKAIERDAPELIPQIDSGDLSINKAVTEIKRRDVIEHLEEVAANEAIQPTGLYDVIVIDPPWPMEKIARDVAPQQVGFDYPTMTLDEISGLDIPSADDCHLWLWTTQKYLPISFELLDGWGFRYVCAFVWHKPGGFQPFGLPQYNCEFALYARKGSVSFIDLKSFNTCFDAPRGGHSEKPSEFYEMVARVTAGRRLDMFNRRPIDGFDGWGKETKRISAESSDFRSVYAASV